MRLTAAITKDENVYVASCLEVRVTSQGATHDEALASLREALELYFEDEPELAKAVAAMAPASVEPIDVAV